MTVKSSIVHYSFQYARNTVSDLRDRSIFALRTAHESSSHLIEKLDSLLDSKPDPIQFGDIVDVIGLIHTFETNWLAELKFMDLYLVTKVRGFDTYNLLTDGTILFPPELKAKVPEAEEDIKDATRCIAFRLSTSAAYHLHRANESVLHVYWDTVSGGKERPDPGHLGNYLRLMRENSYGEKKILDALQALKDFHRNSDHSSTTKIGKH